LPLITQGAFDGMYGYDEFSGPIINAMKLAAGIHSG